MTIKEFLKYLETKAINELPNGLDTELMSVISNDHNLSTEVWMQNLKTSNTKFNLWYNGTASLKLYDY